MLISVYDRRRKARLEHDGGRYYIVTPAGDDYRIPADPIKALGLLDHLAGKTWADAEFLRDCVQAIAVANDWHIHQ